MISPFRFAPVVIPAALALLYCGSEGDNPSGSGGAGPAASSAIASSLSASSTAATTAQTVATAATGGGCTPPPRPAGVPDGWIDYLDWQCNGCLIYLPGSKAALPPPIQWEKCPTSPGGIDCQSMVIDWTDGVIGAVARFGAISNAAGKTVLNFGRSAWGPKVPKVPYYNMNLVAEPDGAVRFALMQMFPDASKGCLVDLRAVQDGREVTEVVGHDAYSEFELSPHGGAFGGAIDDLHPKVLADFGEEDSWYCSASRVYRLTQSLALYAYHWDMTGETLISSPEKDPEGLQLGETIASGDSFFFSTSSSYRAGLNSWNPVDGWRPFIRYFGDSSRGARMLGTDGQTIVWSYGEGRQQGQNYYPVRSIMAAPFTTDPAKLQSKRLRSDPDTQIGGGPWQVACGYAANGAVGKTQAIVVRLSDGVSWLLPSYSYPGFAPQMVIGLTCDHVYLNGFFGGRYNIARVRLDSLGPGILPD